MPNKAGLSQPQAIIIVGAPRCGKTTYKTVYQLRHPGWINIDLDSLREMVAGSRAAFWCEDGNYDTRQVIINIAFDQATVAAIKFQSNLIFSGTNLGDDRGRLLLKRLLVAGYNVSVRILDVGLNELLTRNARSRPEDQVPESMIKKAYRTISGSGGPDWLLEAFNAGKVSFIYD